MASPTLFDASPPPPSNLDVAAPPAPRSRGLLSAFDLLHYGPPVLEKQRNALALTRLALLAVFVLDALVWSMFWQLFLPSRASAEATAVAITGGVLVAALLLYLECSWLVTDWRDQDEEVTR